MNNLRQTLSKKEKLEIINSSIDKVIQKEKKKGFFSKHFDTFKTKWNEYKYARLATGAVLIGGTAIAAASGTLAIAGTLIATRAAISAIGGFIASDAVFDIVNEKTTKDSFEKLLTKAKNTKEKKDLGDLIQKTLKDIENDSKEDIQKKIESIQKKIEKKNVRKNIISTIVGAGVGVLGGSRILEVATTPGAKEVISSVQSKVGNILSSNNVTMNKPVNGNLLKEVFNDIKHDHPKQGYVTIEQGVRRIEGLRNGIGLNESDKLNQFNSSVAHEIRKPNSGIIKAAKSLGYLKDGQNFDNVAKKLTQDKIEKIIVKSYENNPLLIKESIGSSGKNIVQSITANTPINNITENPGVSTLTRIGSTWTGVAGGLGTVFLGKKIAKNSQTSGFKNYIKNDYQRTIRENKETLNGIKDYLKDDYKRTIQGNRNSLSKIKNNLNKAGNGIVDTFGKLLFGKDTYELRKNKNIECPISTGPIENSHENIREDISQNNSGVNGRLLEVQTNLPIVSPRSPINISSNRPRNRINKHYLSRIQNIQNRVEDEFNETEKQKDFINKRLKLFLIINNKLGFNFDSSTYRESNNSYSILATKKTFGGEFAITVDGTPDNIKLKMFWFDHGECKFQEEIKINQVSASNENKFESCIEEVMPYLFKKALLKRDEIKNKEYRDNFHTVEISRNDFASIYKQLREPYVVNNDTEICGNWFQSIYDLNNGVLKMHNLQNPKLHTELRVTGTKCELIPPIDGNWDNHFTQRNRLKYLNNTFDDYELSHLISLSNYKTEEEKSRGGWLERISGKCFNFNWHKHPDSYIEPSSGDLCSSGQIGNFNKYLPLPVITFGIVVKKEAYLRKYGHLYPNAVEIKGRDYGGSQDYVMSYWKVLKQEGVSQYNPSRDLIPVNIRVVD